MRNTFKVLCCFALVMCITLCLSTSALAYNEEYIVHKQGVLLSPGGRDGGSVNFTKGRYVGIIIAGALPYAPDGATGTLEVNVLGACSKSVTFTNQISSQLIWEGTIPNEYTGKYSVWDVYNNSNYDMIYSIAIIERWD